MSKQRYVYQYWHVTAWRGDEMLAWFFHRKSDVPEWLDDNGLDPDTVTFEREGIRDKQDLILALNEQYRE